MFVTLMGPVRELREFVKDLWFRNAQEKERGELELLDTRLEIASKYGLLDTPPAQQRAAELINLPMPQQRPELPPGISGGAE